MRSSPTPRDRLVRSLSDDLRYIEQKLARIAKGEDRHIDGRPRLLTEALSHLGNARVLIAQGLTENPEAARGTAH